MIRATFNNTDIYSHTHVIFRWRSSDAKSFNLATIFYLVPDVKKVIVYGFCNYINMSLELGKN